MKSRESNSSLHEAQRAALGVLAHTSTAQFAELSVAAALSNDHMSFHIRRLLDIGLVERAPKSYGAYRLTRLGKDFASKLDISTNTVKPQPKISIILNVTNAEGLLLRQERLRHPYYGYWARPSGKIRRGEGLVKAAARILLDETGLTATLHIESIGHRIERNESGELIEDKFLYVVAGKEPTGDLIAETPGRKNYWISVQDYDKKEKRFAHPLTKASSIDSESVIFTEQTYTFRTYEY